MNIVVVQYNCTRVATGFAVRMCLLRTIVVELISSAKKEGWVYLHNNTGDVRVT